ncbi:hypothetical protein GT037_007303 [Alternaria burnsii]|uniref:Uncharacterized protein n=1 Tax=Alternaria burnsii TaxID=1187904 RepID=A0A8H7B4Q2_9PLEO|nr:uncharacterized protein GT037_007303 [Alternaria burnsii]KAF7674543.1 hypothetical protein GT037_007303 [Alternaria burnsii]
MFYDLQCTRRGLFELVSVNSVQRIDVVKLHNSNTAGKRLKDTLDLGQCGPYARQSHYFEHPSELDGNTITSRLVAEEVLATPDKQRHALNIIRSWDPQVTSIVILPHRAEFDYIDRLVCRGLDNVQCGCSK